MSQHDAADADFLRALRSRGPAFWVGWRGRGWVRALVTRGRRSVASGASLRGTVAAVACELHELAEHRGARKGRKRPTAGKHAPRCELAGYRLLLVGLD